MKDIPRPFPLYMTVEKYMEILTQAVLASFANNNDGPNRISHVGDIYPSVAYINESVGFVLDTVGREALDNERK